MEGHGCGPVNHSDNVLLLFRFLCVLLENKLLHTSVSPRVVKKLLCSDSICYYEIFPGVPGPLSSLSLLGLSDVPAYVWRWAQGRARCEAVRRCNDTNSSRIFSFFALADKKKQKHSELLGKL